MARKRRGRGEGAIFEKTRRWKSGKTVRERTYWVAVVSEGHDAESGKRQRRFLYADSKKDAQKKLVQYLGRRVGAPNRGASKLVLADFAGRFLEDVGALRSPNTRRSYEQVLRLHTLPTLGKERVDRLDSEAIRSLYADLRRAGLSASLLARVHVTLRRVLNVAVEQGVIQSNPIDRVQAQTYKRSAAKSLTVDQLRRLFEVSRGDRLEALVVLAATSGLRQGELFALRWDDVDLKRGTLSVTHSVEEISGNLRLVEPKSSSGRRRIELSRLAIEALTQRRAIAKEEGHHSAYVFPSPAGTLLRKSNFLRRVYYPLRAKADIPKTLPFHALRHTSASLLLLGGISPKVVQEMLGHADVRLTLNTYSHVLPSLQRQAADALDDLLTPTTDNPIRSNGGTTAVQPRSRGGARHSKRPS